jgi:hypothetical protein
MADKKPLVLNGGELQQIQAGDAIGVSSGGTGADTAASARTNLGLAIGTDVQGYSAFLANIAAMAANGIMVRSAANTVTPRTLTGTAGRIGVTNGDGAAGNPTIDLATVANGGGGSLLKFSIDGYGRVTGTSAVGTADLTALLNGTYLALAGGTLTGYVSAHADPTSAMHLATKQYVDLLASGYTGKVTARAASTGNITTLAGGAPNTLDGVALAANDVVLLKDQTTGSQNGLYVVQTLGTGANGTWVRDPNFDTSAEVKPGLYVFVSEGTANGNNGYSLTTDGPITLGTTALTFTQTSGAGQIIAGAGMTKTGNQLDVGTASTARIVVNADNIDLATVANAGGGSLLKFSIDTYGRVTGTSAPTGADIVSIIGGELQAIDGLGTNGLIVRTGATTAAARTITGTAGNVDVTNGDGVAGNPTINLADVAGLTPGTYQSVTVDQKGRVTAGTTASTEAVTTSLTNGEATNIVIGQAVYVSGANTAKKALANATGTKDVVGFVGSTTVAAAAAASVVTAGVVSATTGQWDAVTGSTGGLTTGAKYFLDNAVAGRITTTPPASGFICPVGIALSTTKLAMNVQTPIQL